MYDQLLKYTEIYTIMVCNITIKIETFQLPLAINTLLSNISFYIYKYIYILNVVIKTENAKIIQRLLKQSRWLKNTIQSFIWFTVTQNFLISAE